MVCVVMLNVLALKITGLVIVKVTDVLCCPYFVQGILKGEVSLYH